MSQDFKEIQIGAISKEIILVEIKRLEITSKERQLNLAEIGSLEKLTKLYCALMDDMRKNMDGNLSEKLQKLVSKEK